MNCPRFLSQNIVKFTTNFCFWRTALLMIQFWYPFTVFLLQPIPLYIKFSASFSNIIPTYVWRSNRTNYSLLNLRSNNHWMKFSVGFFDLVESCRWYFCFWNDFQQHQHVASAWHTTRLTNHNFHVRSTFDKFSTAFKLENENHPKIEYCTINFTK